MKRRDFMRSAACLLMAGALPLSGAGESRSEMPFFLKIGADGTVYFLLNKHEMGQGVAGSLAAILADELGADWERVQVEFMASDPRYRFNTGGSTTISGMYEPLRKVGAAARELLLAAGAVRMGVPVAECDAVNSTVVHRPSGRRAGFGDIAPAAAAAAAGSPEKLQDYLAGIKAPLRPAAQRTLIGKALPNKTHAAIVRGQLHYASDVRLPGMLHAVVARAPVFRGRLRSVDDAAARKVQGVKAVVRVAPYLPMPGKDKEAHWAIHEGVAVLADSPGAAMQGRAQLRLEWDDGANVRHSNDSFRAEMAAAGKVRGKEVHAQGSLQAMPVSATYEYPYQAHACMETMNCTAQVKADNSCEVWIGTQNTGDIVASAARVLGIPAERVKVHHYPSGGSFGRRYYPDVAVEALLISRAAGNVPVKVLWTREDDMRHDHFHFCSLDRYEAAVDADGRITAFAFNEVCAGFAGGALWNPYAIANKHHFVTNVEPQAPLKPGAWRSVTNNAWGMGLECFIDELAHHAGADPLAFRLRHLDGPQTIKAWGSDRTTDPARLRKVLQTAADMAGWGRVLPPGQGLGIACYNYLPCNAHCAHVAQVSADGRVQKIWVALDCGLVVNPDNVRAQVEGNIVWGLTALLKGNVMIDQGRVLNSNFHDNPLLRQSEYPEIEVVLIEGASPTPGGVGETSLPSVIPAVLNALYKASRRRVRRLPLQPFTA